MPRKPEFNEQLYNRLKLEKSVVGPEQRIFKTVTQSWWDSQRKSIPGLNSALDTSLIYKQQTEISPKHTDVYFGEFDTQKVTDWKLNNQVNDKKTKLSEILTGNLINFHDISIDYITNRPDKQYLLNYNNTNSPWFSTAANNAENDQLKNADERIMYFPNYINTPIDMIFCNNNSYFLLPLGTEKYTNILHSDSLLNTYKLRIKFC